MGRFSRRKDNRFFRLILIFASVIFLLFIAASAILWSYLDKISYLNDASKQLDSSVDGTVATSGTETGDDFSVSIEHLEPIGSIPTVPQTKITENRNVINILLIGTDERTTEYSASARADSMILVSINKDLQTVRLVSLERGIGVPILEGDLKGEYDLLTHIFRWGGADLLCRTVEHCFKIEVDSYVRLNFAAVEKVVDVIGGIEVELSEREANALNAGFQSENPGFHTGVNQMNGAHALSFARLRSIDSDWQRVGRQRKVILAVVEKLKDKPFMKLNDLAQEILPLIQTNMTKLEIADLIFYSPNFLSSEFDQMTIPKKGTYGGMQIRNGKGAFAVDYEINNDLLYRFLYEGASSDELLAE